MVETGPKNWFFAHFESFFVYHLVHPWDTPQGFANWKTLLRYICGKFHQYNLNVHFFLYWFNILEMAPFWNFLGPCSPKYCLVLLKFWPEVVYNKKNSVWKILQNLEFWLKCSAIKVNYFGPYWGPIYYWKTKNIVKNQNFCNNCVTSRSHKNHRILAKLNQKTFSGPKLGLNYHHGSKGHQKFSHSL